MIKESEFTYLRKPPEKRISACFDEHEQVIPEGSVMLACALHFFQTGADHVSIHPDGMHLKDINIKMWLKKIGFDKLTQIGQTEAGGLYSKRSKKLEVNPKSGVGDVVAFFGDHKVIIEAKGGVLNTRH